MIRNISNLPFPVTVISVITALNSFEEEFYLTGSRFFGTETANSDWDFFVSKHYFNVIKKLLNLGFKEIPCEKMVDLGYDKNQFSTILELQAVDGVIQIQIIDNIHSKNRVQETIKKEYLFEFNNMSKSERKKFWSLLLNVAK